MIPFISGRPSPGHVSAVAGGPSGNPPTNSVSNETVPYLQDVSEGKVLTSANTISTFTAEFQ
jgi:hypothetical protein